MEHAPRGREGRAEHAPFTSPKLSTGSAFPLLQVTGKQMHNENVTALQRKEISGREELPTTGGHLWTARGVVIPGGRSIVPGGTVCFPSPSTSPEPSTKQALYFPIVNNVCATSPSALSAIHQVSNQLHPECPCPPSEMLAFASHFLTGHTLIHLLIGGSFGNHCKRSWKLCG